MAEHITGIKQSSSSGNSTSGTKGSSSSSTSTSSSSSSSAARHLLQAGSGAALLPVSGMLTMKENTTAPNSNQVGA
jgi:hypothetical protein